MSTDWSFIRRLQAELKNSIIDSRKNVFLGSHDILGSRNICLGNGHKLFADNNILIGFDISSGQDNRIAIGKDQNHVSVGVYDLKKMFDTIEQLNKRVQTLESQTNRT